MTRYRPEYQDRHAPVSAMEPEDRRDLPARREYDDLATPARRARPIFRAGHWQHDPACPLRLRAEQDRPLNPEHEMDNVPQSVGTPGTCPRSSDTTDPAA